MNTITVSNYVLKHTDNWYNDVEMARKLLKQGHSYNLLDNLRYFDSGKHKEAKESVESLCLLVINTSLTEKVLFSIIYGLTEVYSVKHITETKDDFFTAIQEVQFNIVRNNKAKSTDINNEKAVNITNFFFHHTIGKPAL